MGIWIENFEIKGKRYFKFLYAYTEMWYIKKKRRKTLFCMRGGSSIFTCKLDLPSRQIMQCIRWYCIIGVYYAS